jgi:hypothetical protein
LITRVEAGVVVEVVGVVVVVVDELEAGDTALTIRNVPPTKSKTMIRTIGRGGW